MKKNIQQIVFLVFQGHPTHPKFNIAPENDGWKATFLFGGVLFQGRADTLRECNITVIQIQIVPGRCMLSR